MTAHHTIRLKTIHTRLPEGHGLMTDVVKECLGVVLEAVPRCDLPADEVAAWCTHMLAADSVGFVCDEELKALRRQFEAPQP